MSQIVRSTAQWEAELGHRLRIVRRQAGMTQQELADRANVSRSAVKYLESGTGSSLATFVNIIRALDLDASLDQVFAVVSTISPLQKIKELKKLAR